MIKTMPVNIFQSLEVFFAFFPIVGTFFSNHWKIFQPLETFFSNHWKIFQPLESAVTARSYFFGSNSHRSVDIPVRGSFLFQVDPGQECPGYDGIAP